MLLSWPETFCYFTLNEVPSKQMSLSICIKINAPVDVAQIFHQVSGVSSDVSSQ